MNALRPPIPRSRLVRRLEGLIADARVHAPRELAELPQLAGAFGLCLLALALAWVTLP